MEHLQSDYDAITKVIRENPLDSEDDIRGLHLEVVEFVKSFGLELQKHSRKLAEIRELKELIAEMGEDLDTVMGDSPEYLSLEFGTRLLAHNQKGMEITASLVKVMEEELGLNDIRKQQIHAVVEPYLEEAIALATELDEIIDKEEDDNDGGNPDGSDGDGDGDSDGDDGGDDADDTTDAEEEGEAEEA